MKRTYTGSFLVSPDAAGRRFLPANTLLELSGAMISTIIIVTFSVSFAGLIFSGSVAEGLATGIGLGLFSSMILTLAAALGGSFPGLMMCPQDKPAAITGVTVATLAASVAAPQQVPTIVAFIAVTSVIFGIALFAAGYFRLGGLVRYLPYPVVGGFLAGTGVLILFGAFTLVGSPIDWRQLEALIEPDTLMRWFPAMLFGLALYSALRRSSHFLVLPGFILAGALLSYLLFEFIGDGSSLAGAGLTLGSLPERLWQPAVLVDHLGNVNWGFVLANTPSIGAIVLISTIAMLLNETGIEVASRTRMDFNHDMRCTGIGNLAAGLGGGLPGYPLLGLTILNHRLGVSTRFVGLVTALLTLFVLVSGSDLLAVFPRWVVAGVLFYLAIDFLTEWLVDSRRTCSLIEYLMIVIIMVAIVALGVLEGIGIGIVIMAMVFVFNYSRIEVIKNEETGAYRRSNVQRSALLENYLAERGHRTIILELQGYLFFGTTNRVLETVAERISVDREQRPEFFVLDFRQVDGADSSAVLSFLKLRYLAEEQGIIMVFTALGDRLHGQLQRGGCLGEEGVCMAFGDLDRGIEWVENEMLARRADHRMAFSLHESLSNAFQPGKVAQLEAHIEQRDLEAGTLVFRQGEQSDGMYFVERGTVSILLNIDDGEPIRLRKLGSGTLFGEMAFYTNDPRSASVQVEEDARLFFLSNEAMSRIEQETPDLASAFHRYVVGILARRLEHSNKSLFALRR